MNYNKIIEIMNLNDGLSNYVKIYDDYLKTNVEIVNNMNLLYVYIFIMFSQLLQDSRKLKNQNLDTKHLFLKIYKNIQLKRIVNN